MTPFLQSVYQLGPVNISIFYLHISHLYNRPTLPFQYVPKISVNISGSIPVTSLTLECEQRVNGGKECTNENAQNVTEDQSNVDTMTSALEHPWSE